MTEKEKIREYLVGMADAACCNKQTAKDIKDIIIPHIDSMQEEHASEGLMEATNNYCINVRRGYPRVMDETDKYIYNAFKAGANWQKEQMMIKAFGVEIDSSRSDGRCILSGNFAKFNTGDRAKIIIIKED